MILPRVYLCRHEWGQWEPLNDGTERCECLRDGCTYTITEDGHGVQTTRFDPFTDRSTRDYTPEQKRIEAEWLAATHGVLGGYYGI